MHRQATAAPSPRRAGTAPTLSQALPVTPGILVRTDPMAPELWCDLVVDRDDAVSREIAAALRTHRADIHSPWHRLVAVDALDRWLQAPLEPSLIDAERAVTRLSALADLPPGAARDVLLDDALDLARQASFRFETYLRQLVSPVPVALSNALRGLLEGFRALMAADAGADDLGSVVELGDRVVAARHPVDTDNTVFNTPVSQNGASESGFADRALHPSGIVATDDVGRLSLIDPRQLPARVVELAEDPTRGEISCRRNTVNGIEILDVEVSAFRSGGQTASQRGVWERLLARFLDGGSGRMVAIVALTPEKLADEPDKRWLFRTRLPARGLDVAHLRVDILDAAIQLDPVLSDDDPGLIGWRRSMLHLRDQRLGAAARRLDLLSRQPELLHPGCAEKGAARPLVAELALAHQVSLPQTGAGAMRS